MRGAFGGVLHAGDVQIAAHSCDDLLFAFGVGAVAKVDLIHGFQESVFGVDVRADDVDYLLPCCSEQIPIPYHRRVLIHAITMEAIANKVPFAITDFMFTEESKVSMLI